MTNETNFDYFVIGGGSGGVRSARIASSLGARVGLAEMDRLGGTCVIRGCVPKKLFVYASRLGSELATAADYGWRQNGEIPKDYQFDWQYFGSIRNAEIKRLERIYEQILANANVTLFRSKVHLSDHGEISLADGNKITAKKILIATGGTPAAAPWPGGELCLNSDDFFNLQSQPASVIIIGGGFIALEFASIFVRLGTKVTIVIRGDQILRGFDNEIRHNLAVELESKGVTILNERKIERVTQDQDGMKLVFSDGTHVASEKIFSAAGRTPLTDKIGLQELGGEVRPNGNIITKDHYATSVPNIYAIGDVIDGANLTPVAIRQGHFLAQHLFGEPKTAPFVNLDVTPAAVFTTPELGTVGLTEEQARVKHEVEVYRTSFMPLKYTLATNKSRMHIKLITNKHNDQVLGCHILGDGAAEIIQTFAVAINLGVTKGQLNDTIALHPSNAEELITI